MSTPQAALLRRRSGLGRIHEKRSLGFLRGRFVWANLASPTSLIIENNRIMTMNLKCAKQLLSMFDQALIGRSCQRGLQGPPTLWDERRIPAFVVEGGTLSRCPRRVNPVDSRT